eukprot:TRINITY_DN1282_c0_g1_i1.p1 TRINITY_DN1282_c0_g1~~TRINITY_DN1282_c0_g1_i1.p1  ORF type:complete len:226 (-),score=52.92 TRINITY_DN1282_c0_g1_i1:28-639(-)
MLPEDAVNADYSNRLSDVLIKVGSLLKRRASESGDFDYPARKKPRLSPEAEAPKQTDLPMSTTEEVVEENPVSSLKSGWELKVNEEEKEVEPKNPEAKPPDGKETLEGGGVVNGGSGKAAINQEGDESEKNSGSSEERPAKLLRKQVIVQDPSNGGIIEANVDVHKPVVAPVVQSMAGQQLQQRIVKESKEISSSMSSDSSSY